ncbi:MAG TPA: DUF721 domain-containing protein [Desulfobacterales bacterium]|nr:DUF721 domain-containing protein [Desulfobacterales bacterium]
MEYGEKVMRKRSSRTSAGPVSAAKLLDAILTERKWRRQIALHQVFLFWERAVGRDIAAKTLPWCIRKGVLWVKVTDNVWLHHLHLQKRLLLDKLNARLKDVALNDIRFTLDHTIAPQAGKQPQPAPTRLAPLPPVPEDLTSCLATVTDPELRQQIRRAWQTAHRERR